MKKTARELVYDAINWMRKPTADVVLPPIKDSDELKETYGFSDKDVCKLADAIGVDAEMDIPHKPIHMAKTVEEVIQAVESIIKGDDVTSKFKNMIQAASFVMELEGESKDIANIIERFAKRRALFEYLELDTKELDEIDNLFKEYLFKASKGLTPLGKLDGLEKFNNIPMKAIKDRTVELIESRYSKLLDDVQSRK